MSEGLILGRDGGPTEQEHIVEGQCAKTEHITHRTKRITPSLSTIQRTTGNRLGIEHAVLSVTRVRSW